MNTIKIFEALKNEKNEDGLSRRDALNKTLKFGFKAAIAAIPFGLSSIMSDRAFAQTPTPTTVDILNYALTLEYLESEFYQMGLSSSGLVPSGDMTIIAQISKHEDAHVMLLKSTITSLQGSPVAKPTFDFTAGGTFADVFSNYQTFLALSNAFEDTGVRAYKGQAANLLADKAAGAVITAALDIHSVEARHASEIRRLRGFKGWITQAQTNGLPTAIYAGEDNTTQGGKDVRTVTNVSADAITEAFDEPLTMAQVLSIAAPFIKG
jgi:hypothetical protein